MINQSLIFFDSVKKNNKPKCSLTEFKSIETAHIVAAAHHLPQFRKSARRTRTNSHHGPNRHTQRENRHENDVVFRKSRASDQEQQERMQTEP